MTSSWSVLVTKNPQHDIAGTMHWGGPSARAACCWRRTAWCEHCEKIFTWFEQHELTARRHLKLSSFFYNISEPRLVCRRMQRLYPNSNAMLCCRADPAASMWRVYSCTGVVLLYFSMHFISSRHSRPPLHIWWTIKYPCSSLGTPDSIPYTYTLHVYPTCGASAVRPQVQHNADVLGTRPRYRMRSRDGEGEDDDAALWDIMILDEVRDNYRRSWWVWGAWTWWPSNPGVSGDKSKLLHNRCSSITTY